MDRTKQKGTLSFSKDFSDLCQVISSKFAKNFRGDRYLMVFFEFFRDFQTFKSSSSTTKSPAALKLFGNLLETLDEITRWCFDKVLRKIEGSSSYGPSPTYKRFLIHSR